MTDDYNSPGEAPDYIISTRQIIFNIEDAFSEISEIIRLSNTASRENDLAKIDQYLLKIYEHSIQLQNILLEQDQIGKTLSHDFKKLEERAERVNRLCEYLSKMHDVKAHRDIFTANNAVIILTVILVYDAVVKFIKIDVQGLSIRIDTLLIVILLAIFFLIHSKPPEIEENTNRQKNLSLY
jgi:hypothetical protein